MILEHFFLPFIPAASVYEYGPLTPFQTLMTVLAIPITAVRTVPLAKISRDRSAARNFLFVTALNTTVASFQTSASGPKISTIVARTTPLVLIARDRSTAHVILVSEVMDITAQVFHIIIRWIFPPFSLAGSPPRDLQVTAYK